VHGRHDDFEGAIHDRVEILGIQALRHRGESRDVGEHDGDLLALAFDRTLRREDLVGEMLRRVRRRRRESVLCGPLLYGEAVTALAAELLAGGILVPALGALHAAKLLEPKAARRRPDRAQ
jgi:hypothetical protein